MTRATLRTTRRRARPPALGAGRGTRRAREGKRRTLAPAWTQPRTKEEEERLQDAQGQPDGGAAAAAGPARGGRDGRDGAPPERPRRRSGQGALSLREKGREPPPTPSAPIVKFDRFFSRSARAVDRPGAGPIRGPH
ncbi:hypothetical protein Q5P01_000864 [Channa striata]|uniref:Uncharacterized protein n=1 Tax=Channa striata TaxID=64152 RepID=A0AA88LMJ2_CHASR|nr:hypothetical protein Q5P01_000864 [Channa striata]